MGFAIRPAAVHAAAIQHHVDAQLAPGQLLHRRLMQQANRVVSNAQRVALLPHIPGEATVAGIVLQQMGHALGIRQLVDRHHGDFRPSSRFVQCAQYAAADAAKAVYRYADGHAAPEKGRPRRADSPAPGRR